MSDIEAARRYYDRIGRGQDTQRFYEDPAIERLLDRGDFGRARSVVELGCGTGRFASGLLRDRLTPEATYSGFELSERMVTLTQARLAQWGDRATVTRIAGQPQLAIEDGEADRFVANYVLDLMSDAEARRWLTEAHRILDQAGLLCLVSITPGTGRVSRVVSHTWTRIWRRRPMLVGGCRPIELLRLLDSKAWSVIEREVVTAWAVSSEVVIARPA
jgi:ubiquinone/menaquinone biosynthesis C-methylase UbiE